MTIAADTNVVRTVGVETSGDGRDLILSYPGLVPARHYLLRNAVHYDGAATGSMAMPVNKHTLQFSTKSGRSLPQSQLSILWLC